MRDSKPPRPRSGDARPSITGGEPGSAPARYSTRAVVTSRGALRRSCGYARSSSLALSDGADEERIDAPSRARTTTSFQPIRSAKLAS
jgi:hypothetical protein